MESFSKMDHQLVRAALRELSNGHRRAVYLRFWENQSIEDIAQTLGRSWNEVDDLLEEAFEKIRETCEEHQGFSRSLKVLDPHKDRKTG